MHLSLYLTIFSLMTLKKNPFQNIMGKREITGKQYFLSCSQNVFQNVFFCSQVFQPKTNLSFSATFFFVASNVLRWLKYSFQLFLSRFLNYLSNNQHFLLFPQCFLSYIRQASLFEQELMLCANPFTLSQTSPGFYMSAVKVFGKHCGKKRNCS